MVLGRAKPSEVRCWARPPSGDWEALITLLLVMRTTSSALQAGDGPSKEESRRAEKEREQSQKVCPADYLL